MTDQGFHDHDHSACVQDAMAVAEQRCRTEKLRFTKIRRRVLEILLTEHKAMAAYDILAMLGQEGYGTQPPVVYRALEFLVSNGFAHRVEQKNAFIACLNSENAHSPAFLICRLCDAVVETSAKDLRQALAKSARASGFVVESAVIEAEGLCPMCVEAA